MKPRIGTISEGTLDPYDLVQAGIDELHRLRQPGPRLHQSVRRNPHHPFWAEQGTEVWQEVCDDLDGLAYLHLPYTYFGSSPCNASDIGFFVDWESLNEDVREGEVLKVDDLSEVPVKHTGLVLHVNDHGNASLYEFNKGKSKVHWEVV